MSTTSTHGSHRSNDPDGERRTRRSRRNTAFETFTAALTAPAEVIYRLGGEPRGARARHDI